MEAIEPLQFEIEGSGLDTDGEFAQMPGWDDTKLHLLDSAVSEFL